MERRVVALEQEVKSLRSEVRELRSVNEQVLQLLKNNIKAIGLSERMKQKGPGNPRYKNEVETGKVVQDYIKNDYHITVGMIKKYNMSYQGLRLRLKGAGVWRDKEDTVNGAGL